MIDWLALEWLLIGIRMIPRKFDKCPFTFLYSVFDNLLFRPPTPQDIKEYNEVQRVLREEIVNPLRANLFVRADRIMKLRTMLDHLSSVRGLTTEEKGKVHFRV